MTDHERALPARGAAAHHHSCDWHWEHDASECRCELGALRRLARASGEIVRLRLLPAGNCHGDPEQELIDAHGAWVEAIS